MKETRARPKVFWNTLRKVNPGKNNFGEIEKLVINRKEVKDKKHMANSLNEYFTTTASSLLFGRQANTTANSLPSTLAPVVPNTEAAFTFQPVSEEVFKVLRTMDVTKSPGADNIPAKIFRISAPCISRNMANLLNTSYLSEWTFSTVMEGCQNNSSAQGRFPYNYRRISVLPNVPKFHEFFANLDHMKYGQEADLIGEHQYAYARNSSTTVALIQVLDSWK